tara:strand:- start:527 stop:1012 length:486 start_codon:yes stop_codon:yes gene_type:complete
MTQEYLKSLLDYNPETGKLIWKVTRGSIKSGSEAGSTNCLGYRLIGIDGKRYLGHRLAWLWYYGRWPENEIDHINHNPNDNRIKNLRELSHKQNMKNQSLYRNNTSGHAGVHWIRRDKRWLAQIQVNGKKINLGYFKEKEDAVKARKEAEAKYKFHQNHGR